MVSWTNPACWRIDAQNQGFGGRIQIEPDNVPWLAHEVRTRLNQAALHSLYDQTSRIVFTLIARIVTDRRATAEELTVEVFHDVWRRAATYDVAGGPVIGWIMNQARSRAIDRVRFEHRQKRVTPTDTPLPAAAAPTPEQIAHLRDEGRRLREAMSVLTPAERDAIETAFFSELTYYEVATRFNEPLGTVKTRIRSGLGKLRRALADGMRYR